METIVFSVDNRDALGGKGQINNLREQGIAPGVMYQQGKSLPIQASSKELNRILGEYGTNAILKVDCNGNQYQAFIKEVQRDPVNQQLLHFDLQPVSMNEKIQVKIPIQLEGQKLVEGKGGILQRQLREVEIEALPNDVPKLIKVDVSHLGIGDTMQVGDIKVAKGVTILSSPQEIIVSVGEVVIDNNTGEDEEISLDTKEKSD